MRETGTRDHLVVATKFSVPADPHDPNMRGNGRKNILASLEASLRRLQTSYIDLYWLHMWDIITPVEEVMATLDALVRDGKVRAIGLSNVPAWYAAKAQTLAQARGWEPVAALQLEYSLIERTIEQEHAPAAAELGIGIIPWSPLGYGFLTGKYTRTDQGLAGSGRLATGGWPDERGHPDQHWHILDAVTSASKDISRTPAQVAPQLGRHPPRRHLHADRRDIGPPARRQSDRY
jgi:aryl-alcohol dehydrogenase-like predicted oxidoreductase